MDTVKTGLQNLQYAIGAVHIIMGRLHPECALSFARQHERTAGGKGIIRGDHATPVNPAARPCRGGGCPQRQIKAEPASGVSFHVMDPVGISCTGNQIQNLLCLRHPGQLHRGQVDLRSIFSGFKRDPGRAVLPLPDGLATTAALGIDAAARNINADHLIKVASLAAADARTAASPGGSDGAAADLDPAGKIAARAPADTGPAVGTPGANRTAAEANISDQIGNVMAAADTRTAAAIAATAGGSDQTAADRDIAAFPNLAPTDTCGIVAPTGLNHAAGDPDVAGRPVIATANAGSAAIKVNGAAAPGPDCAFVNIDRPAVGGTVATDACALAAPVGFELPWAPDQEGGPALAADPRLSGAAGQRIDRAFGQQEIDIGGSLKFKGTGGAAYAHAAQRNADGRGGCAAVDLNPAGSGSGDTLLHGDGVVSGAGEEKYARPRII